MVELLVVRVPRSHGQRVPPAFEEHSRRILREFERWLQQGGQESELSFIINTVEALFWWSMDDRSLLHPPQDRTDMIGQFRAWCHDNVQSGIHEDEIERYLMTFFDWMESQKVVLRPTS